MNSRKLFLSPLELVTTLAFMSVMIGFWFAMETRNQILINLCLFLGSICDVILWFSLWRRGALKHRKKIVGAFVACSLDPQSIIAMDFRSLEEAKRRVAVLDPPTRHWVLSGMCDDELTTLYEEKDGVVLRNLFADD
jgi:hypothetical protein